MNCLHYCDLLAVPEFSEIIKTGVSSNNILNVNEYFTKSQQLYKIVKYNKDLMDEQTVTKFGLFRSVVINKNNQVVSVSPCKSVKLDNFFEKYSENTDSIIGEEFIEGTMINLFWDPSLGLTGAWEIATRNTVGAHVSFYKNETSKTFNDMFCEACLYNNLNINLLDTNYCYSFVLQHPDNRIVVPFKQPQLFLIEIYQIVNTLKSINVYNQCISDFVNLGFDKSTVKIPEVYKYKNYQDLIDKYASNNSSYDILGIVFKNLATGERTKKRNPVYEEIKGLKGNQPKLQYRYLCLRKEGRVSEYLEYFPEHKTNCNKFRQQLHEFTNTLFSNYKECYVKKQKKITDFPFQYRHHMICIHNIYRTELLPNRLFITNTHVIKYVNNLHPSQQMFSLNYNMRKRIVDFIKVDNSV